jgi:arylsulfatase A-like enzyme
MKNKYLALLFLSIIVSSIGCVRAKTDPPRQAIFILLDAARTDHFSAAGYNKPTTPEMDKLAANGAFFLNCYTQGIHTRASLPGILYSRYFSIPLFPNHHSIPYSSPDVLFRRLDDKALSIPKFLERDGFLTAGIAAHEWLTGETAFGREFKEFYNLHDIVDFKQKYAYPRADAVVDFAVKWISQNIGKDFFLYIHIMDTHFPHFFESDAQSFFDYSEGEYDPNLFAPSGLPKDANALLADGDMAYLNALYDGSMRFTDRQIGRLAGFLREAGLLDTALLMITADHGEFLLDRKGHIGHSGEWYDPIAKVPLIFHSPERIAPGKISDLAELVDLGPTILSFFDIPLPQSLSMDGSNLLHPTGNQKQHKNRLRAKGKKVAFIGEGYAGLRWDDYKGLFDQPSSQLLSEGSTTAQSRALFSETKIKIYDLKSDPDENMDLSSIDIVGKLVNTAYTLYSNKMGPLFKRFQAAKTSLQPRFPFALSAAHFRCDQNVPLFNGIEKRSRVFERLSESHWLRRSGWDSTWIIAEKGAKPMDISLSVPDGKYRISTDVNGTFRFRIKDMEKTVSSAVFKDNLRWPLNMVDIGVFDITGETFSLRIHPVFNETGNSWAGIRLIGFEPLYEGSIPEGNRKQMNEQREERLRSLGYIK